MIFSMLFKIFTFKDQIWAENLPNLAENLEIVGPRLIQGACFFMDFLQALFAWAGSSILLRQIRHPSRSEQSCSGKSGKLFQPDQPCSGKSGKPPCLINPVQANQAIRQTKEIWEKSTFSNSRDPWPCAMWSDQDCWGKVKGWGLLNSDWKYRGLKICL